MNKPFQKLAFLAGAAMLAWASPGAAWAQGTTPTDVADINPDDFADVPTGDGVVSIQATAYAPPTSGYVRYFDPQGNNAASGSQTAPWKTPTQQQLDAIPNGTRATFVFAEGRYPVDGLNIKKAVTLQPANGAKAWLMGSEPIAKTSWQPAGSANTWKTPWTATIKTVWNNADPNLWSKFRDVKDDAYWSNKTIRPDVPLASKRDQVFVDDMPIEQVASLAGLQAKPNTFYLDGAYLYVNIPFNPKTGPQRIDATAYENAFDVNAADTTADNRVIIRGLGFRNYADASVRSYKGNLRLENCTFAYSAVEGAKIGGIRGENSRIKSNIFTYNGRTGFSAGGSWAGQNRTRLIIEDNIASYNNRENFQTNYHAGGMKMTGLDGMVIRRNLFDKNIGQGLWLDLDVERAVVLQNIVRGNAGVGLFCEVSRGVLFAGNFCYNNGIGIMVHGSSGVAVINNTLASNNVNLKVSDTNRYNEPDPLAPKKPTETAAEFAARQAAYNRAVTMAAAQRTRGILYETYEVTVRNNVLANGKTNLNVDQQPAVGSEEAGPMISAGDISHNLFLRWTPQGASGGPYTAAWNLVGTASAAQKYRNLADLQAAAPGFNTPSTEVVKASAGAFFKDEANGDYQLVPCGNGWSVPAANALSPKIVVSEAKGTTGDSFGPEFSFTATEYRALLGLSASAVLQVGADQGRCTTQQAQTITFAPSFANAKVGQQLTLTSTSTGDAAVPVTYSLVNTPTTVATLSGNTLMLVGVGPVTVRASKAGNANYSAALPVDATFTVGQGTPVLTFAALADQTYGAGPLTLAATSTVAALPIAYSLGSTPLTVAMLSGNTLTLVGAGTVTVTATQAGNANYTAAAPVVRTFTVSKASQTLTFAAPADQDFSAGATVALTASSSAGLPAGFTVVSGPATVSGNTLTLTGVGRVTVRTTQDGTNAYAAADPVERSFVARGTVLALNAGGADYAFQGTTYQADRPYATGGTALDRPTVAVANTDADRIYQSERWGEFTYALPVENGTYELNLKFAELFFTAAGQRQFDVLAEGAVLLDNLDVFAAAGGANRAYRPTFTVVVADGTLNLQLRAEPGKNNPQLCALALKRVSDGRASDPTAARSSASATTSAPAPTQLPFGAGEPLSAYPNPSPAGQAPTLTWRAQAAQRVTLRVYNQQGAFAGLYTWSVPEGESTFRLPAGLPAGTYFLKTQLDGQPQSFTLKVE